jgi:hypothetical protein
MELEERIKAREETIEYFESILAIRREETGLPHTVLLHIDRAYRGTSYSIRALKGWNTKNRKAIEELKKLTPPLKAIRMIMTFSIETGRGHETFYAEVTAETVIEADLTVEQRHKISNRLMNATIKLFWIIFDANKAITKDKKQIWGEEVYSRLRDFKNFIHYQVVKSIIPEDIPKIYEILKAHPPIALESAMDNFIYALKQLGCFEERGLDEFVTRQAIIKIGVEYQYAKETDEPKYPLAYLLVEKGGSRETKGEWIFTAKLQISEATDLDMMGLLNMGY